MIHEPIPRQPDERQEYFLKKAAQIAFRSNLVQRHGCLIVNSQTDEILSSGFNHTYIHMYHKFSCHAEYDALRKVKKNIDLANSEMYVVRIGGVRLASDTDLKMSKPCEGCKKLILRANIGRVYYSWSELGPS
jgi:deoxycytidylate deaminase